MEKIFKSPYDLIAEALEINANELDEESAIGITRNWDSIRQLSIVVAIETNYNITVRDEDIYNYDNINTIIKLYNNLSGINAIKKSSKGIIERFKKSHLGKIIFK